MPIWNYLTDILGKEIVPAEWGQASYLRDIETAVQPTVDVPQTAEQEIDLVGFGLQNMEEYQLMVDVKEQWWSSTDFREILEQQRIQKDSSFKEQIGWVEPIIEEPEEIGWLDIWVKTWEIISETAKEFKFESNVDDWIIESWLKFLGNLPANTVQIAWDLITIASDPVWTTKSLLDLWQWLSDKLVRWTLNTIFWKDLEPTENQVMVEAIWAELEKIATTPWEIKALLVENPADVLLAVTGWLNIAKNVAKSKNLTWLASKLEAAERLTNPLKLQAEVIKWTAWAISKWTAKVTEKLIDTTLKLTPSQVSKVRKATVWGKSPSKWLLDNWIIDDTRVLKWQEWIATKLQEFGWESYNKLNKSVANSKGTFVDNNVNKWIDAIIKEIDWVPWLENKIARVTELQTKSKSWLTLSEQLEVKRLIDDTIDLYKVTWDPRAWAAKEWLINIRRWIREAIESEALLQWLWDVKQLSNDIRVSRLIKDWVLNRLDTAWKNRAISLTDIIVWGWAFAWADAWTAIAIIAGKKIIESPAFKLFATKTLRLPWNIIDKVNLWRKFTAKESLIIWNAVQEFITNRSNEVNKILK